MNDNDEKNDINSKLIWDKNKQWQQRKNRSADISISKPFSIYIYIYIPRRHHHDCVAAH